MGYLGGFLVTLRQRGRKNRNTLQYAKDEGGKREKPVRLHGRHVLNRYEDGMEKCIGCESVSYTHLTLPTSDLV